MRKKYDVGGMTCAACSLAVEKSVRKIQGVKDVNVSLLTNSMNVELEDDIDSESIIQAVEKAGYEAKEKNSRQETKRVSPKEMIEKEIKSMDFRLKVSIPLMLILMYVAMGHMMGLPYPAFLAGRENSAIMIFTQLLLTLPIIYVNRSYYINGFKSLYNKNPNMDTLVALGSSAGLVYGIFSTYMISYGLGHNLPQVVDHYMHDIYYESAAMILTLITLGKYLEARSKQKTTDSINKLIDIQPDYVSLVKGDLVEKVPVEDLSIGDLIKIIPGERVAVDGKIVEGHSSLDQSAITGESIPVEVFEGDSVMSGSINMNGSFVMRAEKVGEDTTINKIIQLIEEASASKAPISKLADKISSIFVPAVIGIALVAFVVWMALGYGFEFAFSIAVGILVISCPCALGLATPVAMMVATGKAADNGIIIKNAEGLELLHKSDVMIFDKTGTITKGKPVVTNVVSTSGLDHDKLVEIAYSLEENSQQPLAFAIRNYAKNKSIRLKKAEGFEAITGKGVKARVDGQVYFIGNDKLLKDKGVYSKELGELAKKYSREGKTSVYLFDEQRVLAIFAIADQIKESSKYAIEEIKKMGIKTVMLTGDNELTAHAMAVNAGIDEIRAELLPQDKDKIVSKYQESGIVTMVGDGINDAPALIRADVGIAIADGTDIAIDSADMVLMKSDLMDIVNAIKLSKKTIKNIKENLFWAFIYNVLAIPIAVGILYVPFAIKLNPMIGALAMSLSSVFVVTNALRLKNFKPSHIEKQTYDELILDQEALFEYKIINEESSIKGEETMKNKIFVDQMTCNHCKMRVEKAALEVEGVKNAQVSLEEQSLEFEGDQSLIEQVKKAVLEAGYQIIDK
ncbi:MAG: heavy metal translocating P-type ATPase [Tissierellia bacterium]|nr:heavy metal translocating P-type ATPase [Tissierellia bacterium]